MQGTRHVELQAPSGDADHSEPSGDTRESIGFAAVICVITVNVA